MEQATETANPRGKGFGYKLPRRRAAAARAGQLVPCECWDCLRAEGLTPPFYLRDKHPVRFPHTVMNNSDEGMTGDPEGVPRSGRRQKDEKVKPISADDRSHLREAVRNRVV